MAQQPVVDEDASQPASDSPVQQGGGHRRIDAAAQPANHPVVPYLPAQPRYGIGDEVAGRPGTGAAANLTDEVVEYGHPVRRMLHFRVKL